MDVLLFEDNASRFLEPATISRPAFTISVGARRLVDCVAAWKMPLHAYVREHVRRVVEADFPTVSCAGEVTAAKVLCINARVVPSEANLRVLETLAREDRPGVVRSGDSLAAAVVHQAPGTALTRQADFVDRALATLDLVPLPHTLATLDYAHDIVRHHQATFAENLQLYIAFHGALTQSRDGVFFAAGAKLHETAVIDTSQGPIVLGENATVGPFCYLRGPVLLGANARVLEHASLKDGVATGHTVKIGGEVECSIIEPYTNKQHHGFLGHSYLGSWVNLGAGTCNSDLKNTYGTVNMEYRGADGRPNKVNTGMQFVGAIVGDYAKTAINTGIFTGKTIGACSMVYGFVTTNVPSFVNYARLFGQVTEAPVEVMVSTQRRMFARRGVEQRPCDIELLHAMHALTAADRKALGETLSIEPLSL